MNTARETTLAFVLGTVNYGESDRILTLLTEKHGKLSAKARGARKSWRRFGGALEPFTLFEVALSPQKNRLWNLEEATLIRANEGIAKDLKRLGAASFALELTREISPEHDPHAALFSSLDTVLSLVATGEPASLRGLIIAFQLKCLEMAGLGITADSCNVCGRPAPPGRKVLFHPARGGVVCTPCGGGPITLSKNAAATIVELGRKTLAEGMRPSLPAETLVELENAVGSFLEYHLDRQLKSHSFWRV